MADDDTEVVCANPDCRVAEDGKCVEGFELNACPHYGHAPSEDISVEAVSDEAEATNDVGLPSADTLTVEQAAGLLRAGSARVIAIIGPSDAGKTSLIASLYDLFQEGAVAGVEFAHSRSLHAFEQACHDARAASRRGVPHIARTPIGEVRFYHLCVAEGAAGDGITLALGDRAGEEYNSAAADTAAARTFPEVRRADSLTVLVDGERLLDAGARHNLRSGITMIVQALYDGGAISPGQRLALVLTKIDLILASPERTRAENDFSVLLANLKRLFGGVFSTIEAFQIAASPKTDAVPRGTGLAELLRFWLQPAAEVPTPSLARPEFSRSYARVRPVEETEGAT